MHPQRALLIRKRALQTAPFGFPDFLAVHSKDVDAKSPRQGGGCNEWVAISSNVFFVYYLFAEHSIDTHAKGQHANLCMLIYHTTHTP